MKKHHFFLLLCGFAADSANAITLTAGQTDFTTSGNITTTNAPGINSTLAGSSANPNKIKNLHIITTSGANSSSTTSGIRTTGNYNQITNALGASINTSGSSGRGISISDFSSVTNLGSINTQGSTSYGIYAGGDSNSVNNSGAITTAQSYGVYLNGNVNQFTNSGSITTSSGSTSYGIYISAGSSLVASEASYSSVLNSGTINSASHGIYSKDNFVHITNSGAITSGAASNLYGINNEGDNAVITNSGNVTSTNYAIFNSGANAVINNLGALNGVVKIGNGTLNILGGSISGIVDGSSGAGNINVGSASQLAVNFNQTNSFNGINALTIDYASTLNSSAAIQANTIFIGANSNLTLNAQSSTSALIKGLSDGAGNLNLVGLNFSTTNLIGNLGNSLGGINIDEGSSLKTSKDIYATNILLSGNLDFYDANNLTIFGSLAGSGAGKINIGSNNQIITGNFSLTEGDSLAISLKDGMAGKLDISGSANIDQNSKLIISTLENKKYIPNGSKFVIVKALQPSDIKAIEASNIKVNSNSNISGLLKFTTSASSDSLFLNVDRLAPNEVTQNINAQNIYKSLTQIGASTNGKLLAFQEYLDSKNFSQSEVTSALSQLSPQSTKASLATSSNIANNVIKINESRLNKNRFESENKNGIWAETFVSMLSQAAAKDDEGYKSNSNGIIFGAENEFLENSVSGVALGYSRSGVKSLDSYKNNSISAVQINFYNSANFDNYFVDNIFSFASTQYSSNRAIEAINANATARYCGKIYAAKFKTGFVKDFARDFRFIPEISTNFMRNEIGGYKEKGADSANLNVKSVSANFVESRIGAGLGYMTKIEEFAEFDKFAAILKFSLGYNFVNDAPKTVANFENQSFAFDTKISDTNRTSLNLGWEINAYHKDDITFAAEYNFQRMGSLQSHMLSMKVKQMF